jgi:hypothetical protein
MMNRRQFVGAVAAVAAVAGTGLGALVRRRRVAVEGIDGAVAGDLEGRAVTLRGNDGRPEQGLVTDVRVFATPAGHGAPATEQVSLRVKTAGADPAAGSFRLESDDLVLADLYFSPVGPPGGDRRLEAVVTRIV